MGRAKYNWVLTGFWSSMVGLSLDMATQPILFLHATSSGEDVIRLLGRMSIMWVLFSSFSKWIFRSFSPRYCLPVVPLEDVSASFFSYIQYALLVIHIVILVRYAFKLCLQIGHLIPRSTVPCCDDFVHCIILYDLETTRWFLLIHLYSIISSGSCLTFFQMSVDLFYFRPCKNSDWHRYLEKSERAGEEWGRY